jgi:hypothetical protein
VCDVASLQPHVSPLCVEGVAGVVIYIEVDRCVVVGVAVYVEVDRWMSWMSW